MTETVFVDSFAWIAVINKSDNYHRISLKTLEEFLNLDKIEINGIT